MSSREHLKLLKVRAEMLTSFITTMEIALEYQNNIEDIQFLHNGGGDGHAAHLIDTISSIMSMSSDSRLIRQGDSIISLLQGLEEAFERFKEQYALHQATAIAYQEYLNQQ